MKQFNESFYTKDFDQEMLDFIEQNYDVDKYNGWDVSVRCLAYHKVDEDFYVLKYEHLHAELLTKQEFKEKIGMTKKDFTLEGLEAGKHVVELEDGRKALVVESNIGEKVLFFYKNLRWTHLSNYNQDLKTEEVHLSDIVKVFTFKYFPNEVGNNDLIWQREEKSEAQLQYEECENKMKELQEQMNVLSKKIKEGN